MIGDCAHIRHLFWSLHRRSRLDRMVMNFLQHDIPLSFHTTFKIGGPARFFVEIQDVAQLKEALLFAREKDIPFFILGEGSNLLVSDAGFLGLVIKMGIRGIEWTDKGGKVEVVLSAGEHWDDVVEQTVVRNLSGFENLSGIPGTVGAAPVQNIGAYGTELKDTLLWVEVFNMTTMTTKIISVDECACGYRDSIFKKPEGSGYIVLRVACVLKKDVQVDISYKDLREFFSTKDVASLSVQDVRNAVLSIRKAKLPDLTFYGTAGSFFKNPIVSRDEYDRLRATYSSLSAFDLPDGKKKISAAWILDTLCNFKGYRVGTVGVYKNQALVLINYGNGSAQEIMNLAQTMCDCVKKNTRINLEREVVTIGF